MTFRFGAAWENVVQDALSAVWRATSAQGKAAQRLPKQSPNEKLFLTRS
jgi:hypothetical protein